MMKHAEKIMELLEQGNMVKVNDCNMWLTPDKHYITWQHYGSSANVKNIANLYWILCNIAGDGDMKSKIFINEDRSVYGLNPKLKEVEV